MGSTSADIKGENNDMLKKTITSIKEDNFVIFNINSEHSCGDRFLFHLIFINSKRVVNNRESNNHKYE